MSSADITTVPYTLLLADDSVTIQRVIELTFADEDVRVVAVSDGNQAIARIEAQPPDIVLADVGMPGRNGYEVASYIKHSPRLAHIPVLLLTGAFEPVDQVKAAEAGCNGALAKPFEPHMVIGRVKELLRGASGAPGKPVESRPQAPAEAPVVESGADTSVAPVFDDYFDRLDAAFAELTAPKPLDGQPSRAGVSMPATGDRDWLTISSKPGQHETNEPNDADRSDPLDDDRWDIAISPAGENSHPDLPLATQPYEERLQAAPPPVPVAPPAPVASPPARVAAIVPSRTNPPPLADAFAAILAAEQNGTGAIESLDWLAPAPAPVPPAMAVTDDLVEQITKRVLERFSDGIVRETIADVVSPIAERLFREEIERIKASIS